MSKQTGAQWCQQVGSIGALLLLALPALAQPDPVLPPTAVLRTNVAHARTPPARANALLVLSWDLMDGDTPGDSLLALLREARQLGRRLGDSAVVADADEQVGEYYLAEGDQARAAPWLRRSETQLPYLEPGRRVRVLGNLAAPLLAQGQFGRALPYQRRALRETAFIAALDERTYLRGRLALEISKTFYSQQQLDSTIRWARRAELFFHRPDGRYQLEESYALNQQALVFSGQGHFRTAASYLRRVLATQLALHDPRGPVPTLIALANVVTKQDSGAVALRLLHTARRYVRQNGMKGILPLIFNNLGAAYQACHRPDSAETYYLRAIAAQRQLGGEASTLALHLSAGRFYQKIGRWAAAAQQARAVLAQPAAAALVQQAEAYALLRAEAEHRADFPAAYRFLNQENALRDTLRQHDSRRLAEDLRVRYETAQAEQQVQLLTQRNRLQTQQQELARLRYQRQLALLGTAALLALALLGGGLALYRRRQQQREATLRTQLAADLHDDVGALLTQLAFDTAVLQGQPATSADQHTRLTRMAGASQQAVRQLREVVWSVDSRHDSFASLLDRLRDYAHEVLPAAGVEVDFHAAPELYERALAPPARQALYLIYKEALHNLVKHARATEATIRLALTGHALELTVDDDGPGTPGPGLPQHHGLDNMRRRAQERGGRVAYEPNPVGAGWRVRLTLPLG